MSSLSSGPPRPLKVSIAGIRGVAGSGLTAELAVRLAAAFGTYLREDQRGPTVLLCRDTRPSGLMLAAAVRSALLATGCRVRDLGVCPTPVMQWTVRHAGCDGGVAITAGHGPEHWNALKFVGPDGVFLDANQGAELLDHFHHNRPNWVGFEAVGALEPVEPAALEADLAAHRAAVLALVDAAAIRARRFKVAVDLANGACHRATLALLEALGCVVLPINDEPDQPFPHPPEPSPQNLSQLRALVRAGGADLGFGHDADGDRLGLVTNGGQALSSQYTLTLAAAQVLPRQPGVVVTNLSTSRLVDHVAARHGGQVERVRVGQTWIAEGVHIHHAVLGGEGSGGVMFPALSLAHDSLASIAHLLDLLAASGRPLSALVGDLPSYTWREQRVDLPEGESVQALTALREWAEEQTAATADFTEGVRLSWPDSWVHVRSSITEPMLRAVAEGPAGLVDERLDAVLRIVRG
ncbi:MAG: hypothetical protein IT204_25440 [Fimbriimonadaceae bacterium]|nr:hypothetical protein [Fimbriimonadaceae bacterium]